MTGDPPMRNGQKNWGVGGEGLLFFQSFSEHEVSNGHTSFQHWRTAMGRSKCCKQYETIHVGKCLKCLEILGSASEVVVSQTLNFRSTSTSQGSFSAVSTRFNSRADPEIDKGALPVRETRLEDVSL